MSANDNLRAGIAGGASALNDLVEKYVNYQLQSKLKGQEDYILGSDIPENLRTQLGITPDQRIRKDVLKFYEPSAQYNPETKQWEQVSPFKTQYAPTPKTPPPQKQFISQSEALKRTNAGEKLDPNQYTIINDTQQNKPTEEEKALQKNNAKLMAEKPKARASLRESLSNYQSLENAVDDVLKTPDLWKATGMASYLSNIRGTTSKDINSKIDTIKSKITLDAISSLKSLSKTGATGFGNLSDREGQILQNHVASLDTGQSTEKFKQSLQILKDDVISGRERLLTAYQEAYGEPFSQEINQTNQRFLNSPIIPTEIGLTGYKAKRLQELRMK